MSGSNPLIEPNADPTLRLIDALPRAQDFPVVAQYILCSRLGAGGAGAVFVGYHVRLRRRVAVKVLNPALLGSGEKAVARFEREAILSSQFRSTHIVPVTDAGTVSGTDVHYLVMDLVVGENAEERVARRGGAMGVGEALAIARDATRGLVEAHRAEIIHRDLKPANIMISRSGEVKLADLGIATSLARPNLMLTHAEEFLGTPQYMSPEQIRGEALDGRTDVYSMGVTLYYLLTGRHPFEAQTAYAVMQRVESESLPDVRESRADVPAGVAMLIAAATRGDRDDRIPSAEALLARLDQLLAREGEVSLADVGAGADRPELSAELDDETLRRIGSEVASLTVQQAPPGKRRMTAVLVLLGLVGLGVSGAAVGLALMKETPVPAQVDRAIARNDSAAIAELLPRLRTSGELTGEAREAALMGVADWLVGWSDRASDALRVADGPVASIAGELAAEENERVLAWIARDCGRLASESDWDELASLMEKTGVGRAGAGVLSERVATAVTDVLVHRAREGRVPADEPGAVSVLGSLRALGSEPATWLAALIPADAEPAVRALEADYEASDRLGVLGNRAPAIVAGAFGAAARGDADERTRAVDLLVRLAEAADAQRGDIERGCVAAMERAAGEADWPAVSDWLRLHGQLPGTDGAALGLGLMRTIEASAERGPMGTVTVPGAGVEAVLESLYAGGVQGAAQWLVEMRVQWTPQDQMKFRPAVTPQQRDGFGALLEDAIRLSATDEVRSRLYFVRADAYYYSLINDGDRDRMLCRTLYDGVALGNPDSAARLLDLDFAHRVERGTIIEHYEKLGLPVPKWPAVARLLEDAVEAERYGAGTPARVRVGYGAWLMFMEKLNIPGRSRSDESERRAWGSRLLLEQFEAGVLSATVWLNTAYLSGWMSEADESRYESWYKERGLPLPD